jgi:hypothetical protein
MQDFPTTDFYFNNLPRHRFLDFSRSQLNSHIIQHASNFQDRSFEGLNFQHIKKDKRLHLLNPSLNQVQKSPKKQSFTVYKRPELFPVRDEHKNPCSYLASNFTGLNKKAVS